MGGGGVIGGKNFFGPKFVFLCLWRQHPFLHKTKGPTRNPISPTPPLLRRASMSPPPVEQFSGCPVNTALHRAGQYSSGTQHPHREEGGCSAWLCIVDGPTTAVSRAYQPGVGRENSGAAGVWDVTPRGVGTCGGCRGGGGDTPQPSAPRGRGGGSPPLLVDPKRTPPRPPPSLPLGGEGLLPHHHKCTKNQEV